MFLIKVVPLSEFNLRYFIKSLIFNIFFWLVCLAFTFCNYIYRVSTTSSCICPKYRLWRKLAKKFFENNEFFVQNAVQNVTTFIANFLPTVRALMPLQYLCGMLIYIGLSLGK